MVDRKGGSAFQLTPSVELLAERFPDTNVEGSEGGGRVESQDCPLIESEDGRGKCKRDIAWPRRTR